MSITIDKGELVGVLGPNGAGKTTLLKAISRVIPATGILKFRAKRSTGFRLTTSSPVASVTARKGRRLFPELSVLKNLQLGAYLRSTRPRFSTILIACSRCFQFLGSASSSSRVRCRAASSRCWRLGGR